MDPKPRKKPKKRVIAKCTCRPGLTYTERQALHSLITVVKHMVNRLPRDYERVAHYERDQLDEAARRLGLPATRSDGSAGLVWSDPTERDYDPDEDRTP